MINNKCSRYYDVAKNGSRLLVSLRVPVVEAVEKSAWDYNEVSKLVSTYMHGGIPDEDIDEVSKSIPALTTKGFLYFMPEFICYSLDHPDSEVTDHLLTALCPPFGGGGEWVDKYISEASQNEKAVVYSYLSYIHCIDSDEFDGQYALRGLPLWR